MKWFQSVCYHQLSLCAVSFVTHTHWSCGKPEEKQDLLQEWESLQ